MQDFIKAILLLKQGGVIAHATETCYGFACDIYDREALKSLYKLKKMDIKKPVSIMVASMKQAKKYGFFSKKSEQLAKKYWPGPLTIIVKRKKFLPKFLNPSIKTIGIRVPGHELTLKILRRFGGPLATTSANISGSPSPYSVSAIKKQFAGEKIKPDFILDSGRLPKNPPSTIIDMSARRIKILRKGKIKIFEFRTQN